jgi:drug/metabolite transporter (DMT)-like permease
VSCDPVIENRRYFRGYLYIATATFFWGVSAALGRAVFTGRLFHSVSPGSIDPLILSQSRTTFAFLIFLPALLVARGWRRLRVPVADVWRLFLLGVFGVAASNYFYYLAIQRTGVATAITVQYTAPVWVLLYMVVTGRQRPTLKRAAAVGLALVGIGLVVGVFRSGGLLLDGIGIMAALLAAFSFALYNIGGHNLVARYDPWSVLLYITLSASAFWIVLNPPWKILARHYSLSAWEFLFVFSVVSVLAPFSFYISGLRYLDPTRAIVVGCMEPVFSILITAIALGEGVRPVQLAGIGLVLAAILAVQLPDRNSTRMISAGPVD